MNVEVREELKNLLKNSELPIILGEGGIYANLGCRAIDRTSLLKIFKESKVIR